MAVEMLGSLPKYFKDVLKIRKKDQEPWMTAMKEEIKSLHERKVWDLIDLPKGHQTVKGRWVYTVMSTMTVKNDTFVPTYPQGYFQSGTEIQHA